MIFNVWVVNVLLSLNRLIWVIDNFVFVNVWVIVFIGFKFMIFGFNFVCV